MLGFVNDAIRKQGSERSILMVFANIFPTFVDHPDNPKLSVCITTKAGEEYFSKKFLTDLNKDLKGKYPYAEISIPYGAK